MRLFIMLSVLFTIVVCVACPRPAQVKLAWPPELEAVVPEKGWEKPKEVKEHD